MKITKNMFQIKSFRTGSVIRGRENQVAYKVLLKDGTKAVTDKVFYRKADAEKWLSDTIRIANLIKSNPN